MNQLVYKKIEDQYYLLNTKYWDSGMDKKEYTRQKMILFKKYMTYEEEFVAFFINTRSCYPYPEVFRLCDDLECEDCCKNYMFNHLLTQINHYE